jgi:hypothetical protein
MFPSEAYPGIWQESLIFFPPMDLFIRISPWMFQKQESDAKKTNCRKVNKRQDEQAGVWGQSTVAAGCPGRQSSGP